MQLGGSSPSFSGCYPHFPVRSGRPDTALLPSLRSWVCLPHARPDSGTLSLQVMQKYSLVVVQGHLVCEGLLLFGQQHFYICENFTLSPVGDVYCTRHCLSK